MNPTKSDLRRKLKQARLALSPAERQTKSTAIVGHLWQAVDWSQVATLHCYEPIERLGEVDLTDFITALQTGFPKIRLFTSIQKGDDWQIASITNSKPAPDINFDVIIVPMLGFDKSLHRLGYGGGYYDKFLIAQPQAQKIGVCFEQGRLDQLPTEPYDIPLDLIISEMAMYRVNRSLMPFVYHIPP